VQKKELYVSAVEQVLSAADQAKEESDSSAASESPGTAPVD
jgi:hypothetical protein